MHCPGHVSVLFSLLLLLVLPCFPLRFHPDCRNFAGRGDVTGAIETAAEHAQKVAANARDQLASLNQLPTPQSDRIHRILGAYSLGVGQQHHARTTARLIALYKVLAETDLETIPTTIYCGTSNPALWRRLSASLPDGTDSFRYIARVTSPAFLTEIGQPLCQDNQDMRALTEYKVFGGTFMVFCPAAFEDDPLPGSFPITDAARDANFSSTRGPGEFIEDYSLSLSGVFLHELHHALIDPTADIPLRPPLVLEGEEIELAYGYFGTTELARQVRDNQQFGLIYRNADTCSIIAIAIWLRGAAWHRGFASVYAGMPSASRPVTRRREARRLRALAPTGRQHSMGRAGRLS
ncbi:MAG: hypothetical protein Q9169_006154 [Polycauliona sp. 2 TL-2023]